MKKKLTVGLILLGISLGIVISFGLIKFINKKDNNKIEEITTYRYDCEFTKVFNILSLLTEYNNNESGISYILVGDAKENTPQILKVPKILIENLDISQTYLITFRIDYLSSTQISKFEIVNKSEVVKLEPFEVSTTNSTSKCNPK